jgi:cytochrome c551/c552
MKISKNQMFINFRKWCLGIVSVMLFAGSFNANAQGEALFKAKCASCHQPLKDGTGPKLSQVRTKWADGGAKEGSLYQWVKNWQSAAASDPYAKGVTSWSATAMTSAPDLTDDQITQIFDWVDAQVEVVAPVAGADPVAGEEVVEEESTTWLWVLMGVIFTTIILAVGGVRRQLKHVTADAKGETIKEGLTYTEELRTWAWKNRKFVMLSCLVLFIAMCVSGILGLSTIGVVEEYQPSQPIEFPHAIHTGTNGIDCKYCHNSVTKSKSAGLPTVNVCMNCHKQINGRTPAQQVQIAKIYEAAGWDGKGYTGKTKEIVWNKVHSLPDHVYFNHSQHVVVGGLDCKQCHGDMTQQVKTAQVRTVQELNKIEGNVVLTRPTLTMGWCIECHGEKEISTGSIDSKNDGYYNEIHKRLLNNDKTLYNKYLEDGKVTVKELGGWECAKCHY